MPNENKNELVSKNNEILKKLQSGANESGSCDYPNIQRFGFTSKEEKSSDKGSNRME